MKLTSGWSTFQLCRWITVLMALRRRAYWFLDVFSDRIRQKLSFMTVSLGIPSLILLCSTGVRG
jgi:hypothetical protein